MTKKVDRCCICHNTVDRYDIIRLNKQLYYIGSYRQFSSTGCNYDICKNCYRVFEKWLKKHEINNEEEV